MSAAETGGNAPSHDPAAGSDAFASLEAQAHQLETGTIPEGLPGAPPPAPPPALAGPDPAKLAENAAIFDLLFGLLLPWAPDRYAQPYGEKQRAEIARSFTVLEQKRGWDLAEALEGWAPELAFGVALLGPIAGIAMRDLKALRDRRIAEAKGKPETPPGPNQ